MGRWDGWLLRTAATILAVSTATSSGPGDTENGAEQEAQPTASHYVVSTGDSEQPDAQGYRTGCADGRAGRSGLRMLLFGTQEKDGRIRPPGTTVSSPAARVTQDWVIGSSVGWMRGFAECGKASAVLAIGVNNKSDGGADPAQAGADWARLVQRVAAVAPPGRVVVSGAMDGEPSWSPAGWARAWVDAFVHGTPRVLYAAGSADGCPSDASSQACSRGWTVGDVFHISTGAAKTVVALPQIYRTDGIQARQWAAISGWGVRSGAGPLRVVGVLSQRAACRQQSGCTNTDNSAADARDQLAKALAADPATRTPVPLVTTDMDWPTPPPSP
ncbi:MAG: hypothetical protein QOD96_4874 [Pseudonocardiales bacterium]|nr:hypothetical protein [Pseudonocardiales bacterium]